jgi:hypothetical protein
MNIKNKEITKENLIEDIESIISILNKVESGEIKDIVDFLRFNSKILRHKVSLFRQLRDVNGRDSEIIDIYFQLTIEHKKENTSMFIVRFYKKFDAFNKIEIIDLLSLGGDDGDSSDFYEVNKCKQVFLVELFDAIKEKNETGIKECLINKEDFL